VNAEAGDFGAGRLLKADVVLLRVETAKQPDRLKKFKVVRFGEEAILEFSQRLYRRIF
jgi:hypothetical protein